MYDFIKVKYKNILDIENLNIPDKKVTCIVGESGSGKTTLLRLLNKMISPDSGDIFFNNKSLKDIDSISLRRKVSMLSQDAAIFEGTVRDNLEIGFKFAEKSPASDNDLLKVLNTVHLDKLITDDASKLSGGEKQRLALARIILLNPDVLLLDEPTSALDEETSQIVIDNAVEYVKQHDKTLIMVTHSKNISENFSENTIKICKGKISLD